MAAPDETPRYDIVFVADARFEGGASTALVQEIVAARRGGLTAGLLMVKGSLLARAPFFVHPDITALVTAGAVAVLDPARRATARLVLVHHPTIFALPPQRPVMVEGESVVLVLHHPRLDRTGRVQYDLPAIVDICARAFGRPVTLAPVSAIVRAALPVPLPAGAAVLDEDWHNIIDAAEWTPRAARPLRYPVVIGRHARPDALKWPDTREEALAAYSPDAEFCRVRVLGGGPFLAELYGDLPANWEIVPFAFEAVQAFLRSLDVYVYFHSDAWSEAFGRTVLEAMAAGVPAILPAYFRQSFGDAALYATPAEVAPLIERLVANPLQYERQVQRGLAFARRHGPESFLGRLERLYGLAAGPERAAAPAVRTAPARKRVLFISTNGIGIGHLTQQLAIAARLPDGFEAVFATMSYALSLIRDAGYLAHFLSYHRHYGADPHRWNQGLREELIDLIAFTRPDVIAYDGSYPFDGLLRALAEFRSIVSIWVRRPMWRESHASGLSGTDGFDHVLEPGELADAFDDGPTKAQQRWSYCVDPILHIDPEDRLAREEARRALDLPDGALAVALQLGSGRNTDLASLREAMIARILRSPDAIVVELRSPIRADFAPETVLGPRHRIVERFPSFRLSRAFDFAVAAAGYNNFHENVLGALPTIFVPNEAPEMDVQLSRARFADIYGYGLCLRREHGRFALDEAVERLADPGGRAEIARRCAALPYCNGAVAAARLVADSAFFLRTDIPFVRAPEPTP